MKYLVPGIKGLLFGERKVMDFSPVTISLIAGRPSSKSTRIVPAIISSLFPVNVIARMSSLVIVSTMPPHTL